MHVGFLITCPPAPAPPARAALEAVEGALDRGEAVRQVFFHAAGVEHAARAGAALAARWGGVAARGVDLVVCNTAAARRNIAPDDLKPGFRLSGLAPLIESALEADAFRCFGPEAPAAPVAGPGGRERGFLIVLGRGPEAGPVVREAVETALLAAAFGVPVSLLLTGPGAQLLAAEAAAGIPELDELWAQLEHCYAVLPLAPAEPAGVRRLTAGQAAAVRSEYAVCLEF